MIQGRDSLIDRITQVRLRRHLRARRVIKPVCQFTTEVNASDPAADGSSVDPSSRTQRA